MRTPFTINGRFLTQNITGVQRVARELLSQFDRLAAKGDILAPRVLVPRAPIVAPPDLQKIRIEYCGKLTGHAWEQLELPRFCGNGPLLCLGNTAPLWSLYNRKNSVIAMVHDLSYKYFPEAYSWKFRALYGNIIPQVLRHADRVVTVSAAEMDMMGSHYDFLRDSGRFSYLQNGGVLDAVSEATSYTNLPSKEDRTYGIYVGSLTNRKNAKGVLEAAARFVDEFPDMEFLVVGATSKSFEDVDINVSQGSQGRIKFLGQIDDAKQIYDLYKHARFLLFPSFYEASPLPPIESMTFGCPVVSSDIPSLVERCGDAAVYCRPNDPDSVFGAVRKLMDDSEFWEKCSRKSKEMSVKYSWNKQARGILELCKEVS